MAETYSVEAILTARDAGFEAGMKAAQKSTQSLGAVLKKGIGFGAMMAIGNKAVSVVTLRTVRCSWYKKHNKTCKGFWRISSSCRKSTTSNENFIPASNSDGSKA